MDGILNINKPAGVTSFDVVAAIRRLARTKRVGHAGTLDPLASGVLPVCLGRATRVVEYMADARKKYRAEIELGIETDTYDADGTVLKKAGTSAVSLDTIKAALPAFTGTIRQTPPMYSAVKRGGTPLYRLARAGVTVERASRLIEIHRLEILDWRNPVLTLDVTCGKGTYIRSLAHDLGGVLGCGASIKGLVRLEYGPFKIGEAVSMARLAEVQLDSWHEIIHPIDFVLSAMPRADVSEAAAQMIKTGKLLVPGADIPQSVEPGSGQRCRAYTLDGSFVGVLRFNAEKGRWQPEKVFARS